MAQTYGKGLGISQSYTGKKKKDEEKKKVTYNYTPDTGKYFGVSQKSTDRKTGSGRTVSKTYNHMDMVNPSVSASQKRTQQKKEQQKFTYQSNLNKSRTTTAEEKEKEKNLSIDTSLNRSKGSLNYTKRQAEKETEKNNSNFASWRDKADKVTYKNEQERLNAIKEGRKYNTLRYDDYGLSEEKLQEFDAMFGNESTRQLAKEGASLYRSRKQTQRKVQKKEDELRNAQLKSNQNIAFNYSNEASNIQKQIDDIRSGKKKVDNANWEIQRLNNKRADYEAKAREYQQYADYDNTVASRITEMYNDKDAQKYIQRGKTDDNFIGKPSWDMGGLYPGAHMFDEDDSVSLAMMQANDQEKALYDYINGKYGEEEAKKVAEMMYEQGGLGNRYADYIGKQLDNPVYNGVQAFNAGAQNSIFGLRDAVDRMTGADNVHVEGLMNKIYQQNVQSGRLNKIAGDVIYNVGNMMPAIAVSVATGGVASPAVAGVLSAGVTGASSFGNTYQQARREGFDAESATVYAAINGASEAALQYALNGIGAMAGGGVTKALSSAAEKAVESLCTKAVPRAILKSVLGQCINALGEFEEEYLQEILDPVFRNWALGEANGFEPFTEEALYAGLLGALSAGFMNGVSIAGEQVKIRQFGKIFNTTSEEMVKESLKLPPTEQAYRTAKEFDEMQRGEDGKLKLTNLDAGVLAQQMANANDTINESDEALKKNGSNWNGLSDATRLALVNPKNAKYFSKRYGLNINENMAPEEIAQVIKSKMEEADLMKGWIPVNHSASGVDPKIISSLNTLGDRANLAFYVSDSLKENALVVGNKIILSRDAANTEQGVKTAITHELTHASELTQHYEQLRIAVLKILQNETKGRVDALVQKKIDLYKENNWELTEEGAYAEVVADYCENTFFEDLDSLVDFLAGNRSLGQRIMEWFKQRFNSAAPKSEEQKLYGKALNNFRKAFNEIENTSTYDRLMHQDTISRPITPENTPDEEFYDLIERASIEDELNEEFSESDEFYDPAEAVDDTHGLSDFLLQARQSIEEYANKNNLTKDEKEFMLLYLDLIPSYEASGTAKKMLEFKAGDANRISQLKLAAGSIREDVWENSAKKRGQASVNTDINGEEYREWVDNFIDGKLDLSAVEDLNPRIESDMDQRTGYAISKLALSELIIDGFEERINNNEQEIESILNGYLNVEDQENHIERLNKENAKLEEAVAEWKDNAFSAEEELPPGFDKTQRHFRDYYNKIAGFYKNALTYGAENIVQYGENLPYKKRTPEGAEKPVPEQNSISNDEAQKRNARYLRDLVVNKKGSISGEEYDSFVKRNGFPPINTLFGWEDAGFEPAKSKNTDKYGLLRYADGKLARDESYDPIMFSENKTSPDLKAYDYLDMYVPSDTGEDFYEKKRVAVYAGRQFKRSSSAKTEQNLSYDTSINKNAINKQRANYARKRYGSQPLTYPEKAVAFTGHRPNRLSRSEADIKADIRKEAIKAIESGHDTFITGMAMGSDIMAGEVITELKQEYPEIKLIGAIPFNGHTSMWSDEWKTRFNDLLNKLDLVQYISKYQTNKSYSMRNKWMVDNADEVIAIYNGRKSGTGNTVEYAKSNNKNVNVISPEKTSSLRGQASIKETANPKFDSKAPNYEDLIHVKKESGVATRKDLKQSLDNLKEMAAIQIVDSLASFEGIDNQIARQLDSTIAGIQNKIVSLKKGTMVAANTKEEIKKLRKNIDSLRKAQQEVKHVYWAANNTRNASSAADFTIGLDTSKQGTFQADYAGNKIVQRESVFKRDEDGNILRDEKGNAIEGDIIYDENGKPAVCKNLHDIWAPIFEKAETNPQYYIDFQKFLRLMDHADRVKLGEPTLPSDELGIDFEKYNKTGYRSKAPKPMSREEAIEKANEILIANPEFAEYAREVWQFNHNNLKYLFDSGSISKELFEKLIETHEHYIPADRDVDTKYGDTAFNTNPVSRAKGAINLPFIPTDQAMATQTRKYIIAARRNQLMNAVASAYEAHGKVISNFVKEIIPEVDENTKAITDHEMTIGEVEAAFNPELDDKTNTTNHIIFFQNGRKMQATVSDGIYKGYTSLWGGMSDFERVVGAPTRALGTFFRNFVTNYNPVFVATNFLKDFGDAIFYTQDTGKFLKNFGRAWKQIVSNGDVWQLYKASGGFNSSFFEIGQGMNQSRNFFQRNFLDKIEKANLFVEQAPRLAEFMTSLEMSGVLDSKGNLKSSSTDLMVEDKSGKISQSQVLDIETLRKAMYAANDITVNFGRGGLLTKKVNRSLVPFLNASVQGFSKVVRQFNQRGGKAWARLALKASVLGVAPAVINSILYKDDDEWKHMTNWNKDNNYMFKLGNGKWLAIPRGRFMSFFAGLGNRAVQAMNGDKVDWQSLGELVETNIAPASVFDNNILAPIYRAINNKNWYGKSIDSYEDLKKRPEERYDETTSEICKAIGKALGISPKRVQDLFESYTGFIADVVVPATNLKSDTPVLDSFTQKFIKDPVYSNDYSSLFREYKDTIQQAVNYEGEDDVTSVLGFKLKYLNNQSKEIAKLYDSISALESSNASDEDKREGTRAIRMRLNLAYQSSVNNAELLEKQIEKYYKVDPGASTKVQQRQAWYAYSRAMKDLFGAEEGLKAAGLSEDKIVDLVKKGINLDDYFDYYSSTHSGDKYFSTDEDGNAQSYSYAEKRQKLLDLKLDEKSTRAIYKNEFENKKTEANKSIDYAIKNGVSAKDFVRTSVKFSEIGEADLDEDDMSKTLQKKEWLLNNIKNEKSLDTLYKMYFESDKTDEEDTIDYAHSLGVSTSSIIKREIQKSTEEGDKSGETKTNYRYENGQIIEETSDKYVSGSKLVKAVHNMLNSGYTEDEMKYFYQKEYGSDDAFVWALQSGMDAETYLKYREDTAMITADKNADGKSISGSKKKKIFAAINNMDISRTEKLMLFMRDYALTSDQYREVFSYINSLNLSGEEKLRLAEQLGFMVVDGKVYMKKAS